VWELGAAALLTSALGRLGDRASAQPKPVSVDVGHLSAALLGRLSPEAASRPDGRTDSTMACLGAA